MEEWIEDGSGLIGVRHRAKYRGQDIYINIHPMKPEVFISCVEQDQDPYVGAVFDAMARMVTMAWTSGTLDRVIDQLRKSSRTKSDLPDILARLLSEEIEDEGQSLEPVS